MDSPTAASSIRTVRDDASYHHLPFDSLADMAVERRLLDRWEQSNDAFILQVGSLVVEVRETAAQTLLAGMLRSFDQTVR